MRLQSLHQLTLYQPLEGAVLEQELCFNLEPTQNENKWTFWFSMTLVRTRTSLSTKGPANDGSSVVIASIDAQLDDNLNASFT